MVDARWGCWASVLGRADTPSHNLVTGSHHRQLPRGGATQTPSSEVRQEPGYSPHPRRERRKGGRELARGGRRWERGMMQALHAPSLEKQPRTLAVRSPRSAGVLNVFTQSPKENKQGAAFPRVGRPTILVTLSILRVSHLALPIT